MSIFTWPWKPQKIGVVETPRFADMTDEEKAQSRNRRFTKSQQNIVRWRKVIKCYEGATNARDANRFSMAKAA